MEGIIYVYPDADVDLDVDKACMPASSNHFTVFLAKILCIRTCRDFWFPATEPWNYILIVPEFI